MYSFIHSNNFTVDTKIGNIVLNSAIIVFIMHMIVILHCFAIFIDWYCHSRLEKSEYVLYKK